MRVPPCVLTVEKPVFLNTPNQTQGEEITLLQHGDAACDQTLMGGCEGTGEERSVVVMHKKKLVSSGG